MIKVPMVLLGLFFLYMIGMGLANDICDCVKDWDGWWRLEWTTHN